MSLLDGNARRFIVDYNRDPAGPHYNSVAGAVYGAGLEAGDTLSPQFEPAILDGLMGFGMGIAIKGGALYSQTTSSPLHGGLAEPTRHTRI